MSSYYEDGKEIIVIEDVSFASPEGGLLAGSAASSGNIGGRTSLSKDVDTSTTPVHVSSDDESPASKNMDCLSPPDAIIHMASQSSDEEFGNGISPMVFHSQELMDDDLFAVKQIFPTTTTSVNNNVTHEDDLFIRPKPRVHGPALTVDKSKNLAVDEHNLKTRKEQSCNSNINDVENKKQLMNRKRDDANRSSGAGSSITSDGASSLSKKECAKRKRQELKKIARQQKELEKEKKKLKRQETLRANGKYQFDEIVVNFENSLYKSTIGERIGSIIQEEEKYGSKLARFQVLNSNDSQSKATNRYLNNSIEWTRQVPGQPCSGFVWTAAVYNGDDFYEFLLDYKEKMKFNRASDASLIRIVKSLRLYQKPWIEEFQRKREQSMHFGVKFVKSKPRIIMIITGWSKSLSAKNKLNRKKKIVITEADVMSASNDIYVRYDVEIQCFDSIEQAGKELKGITRYLATKPYSKDKNSLSFIKKARVPMSMGFYKDPQRELRRTFMRMLMQINGISAKKALNITNHYPTFKTLYDMYHNSSLTVDERKALLANIITDNGRSSHALSAKIFKFMTGDDHQDVP